MAALEGYSLELSAIEAARSKVDIADLVPAYSSLLFRVAHSVLRSRSEAEDVVQEVFLRVLKHRRSLSGVQDMRVWLVRIAWNLALDRRRRIRPEQIDDRFAEKLIGEEVPADQVLAEADRLKTVLRELERLPRAERHVLLLSAVEEMETTEMAQVLGRSESAVRALLFRARTRLKERLEQKGDRR